jgi:hypothetical protein
MMRADRLFDHNCESQTHMHRSMGLRTSLLGLCVCFSRELMAPRNDLGLHCGAGPKANEKGIEQYQNKVEHSGGSLTSVGTQIQQFKMRM